MEHLLSKEDSTGLIRLQAWKSICASALYLARKNIPFSSSISLDLGVLKFFRMLQIRASAT